MSNYYEIRGTMFGSKKVVYLCPNCSTELESSLNDAGKADSCPKCNARYKVPGTKELNADKEEEARRDQERQEEAERKRIISIEHRAEKMLKKTQAHTQEDEGHQKTTVADRVLRLAFSLGKYLSVFVIAICMLVITGSLVVLLYTFSNQIEPNFRPNSDDYIRQMKDFRNTESGAVDKGSDGGITHLDQELAAMVKQYKLNKYQTNLILEGVIERDMRYTWDYVNGLKECLSEWSQANMDADDTVIDPVLWYNTEWIRNEVEYESALARTSATRWLMLNILVVATCALLAFLILPLLIQIERNTRMLLFRD